ncbi:MAG: hypothetical protein DRP54_06560 [Spirochaetes bacterium]|nr:MAG: hypothetical protein DRP54_06560 [Spirochaetota bacterium]
MVKTEKAIRIFVLREKPEQWKERGKFSFRIIPPPGIKIKEPTHGREGYFVYGKGKEYLVKILHEIAKAIIESR